MSPYPITPAVRPHSCTPDALRRLAAGPIVDRGLAHVAEYVECECERQLGRRRHEALVGPAHEDAGGRRRIDVDRRDVDGSAQERDQLATSLEQRLLAGRAAVGDDHVTAGSSLDQLGGREVALGTGSW